MPNPPDSPDPSPNPNPMTNLIHSIFSYDGNVLLAAIVSLLLVILFVLLLHVYAKWFLSHTRHRRRRRLVSVSDIVGPAPPRFHYFDTGLTTFPAKGLDASVISSIPLFVYGANDRIQGFLQCVICLSVFEERELARKLPECGHGFHVECIDMWLGSHANCPICRAPVVVECKAAEMELVSNDAREGPELEVVTEVPNFENGDEVAVVNDSVSASSLGGSLKRMLSRDRSECRVHPSANVNGSEN